MGHCPEIKQSLIVGKLLTVKATGTTRKRTRCQPMKIAAQREYSGSLAFLQESVQNRFMMKNSGLNSMTGYGRGEAEIDQVRIVTEIRSVNHRFLDIVVRLPAGWLSFEEGMKRVVKKYIKRGRVDVFVSVEGQLSPEKQVTVDWKLVAGYVQASKEIEKHFNIQGELTLSDLIRLPDIWLIEESKWDEDHYRSALFASLEKACEALQAMREQEGQHLAEDLAFRIQKISGIVAEMEELAPQVVESLEKRLYDKLKEWIHENQEMEDRILAEIAVFADKADITEELTRLKSHTKKFLESLSSEEPIGRRLDFLLQEMNREVNTIGSKANHQSISMLVVDAKSELEKMKEQVQNIE
ncbi:YicC/YloC family endoribonuclease [Thermoflavimicrobium dichotomicum]|uniref:TIGR00255 family protein n=1 Tax=Thermoflavimicrobium dichotomicum TaxID=46223 RepID=A0A1I3SUR4_9BACL|nr:YicC/YloC family endoribonuclease [Thermoflavimicrobium dichotomicum]SFJ62123.1 TIGR00255 family protein [Thermoflavimicrobium dichotomicum]